MKLIDCQQVDSPFFRSLDDGTTWSTIGVGLEGGQRRWVYDAPTFAVRVGVQVLWDDPGQHIAQEVEHLLARGVLTEAAIEGVGDLVGGKVFSALGSGLKMAGGKLFVGNRAIEGAEEISKELARVGKTIKPEDIPQFMGRKLPNIEAGLDPAQKSSSKLTAWLLGSLERAFGAGVGRVQPVDAAVP